MLLPFNTAVHEPLDGDGIFVQMCINQQSKFPVHVGSFEMFVMLLVSDINKLLKKFVVKN